MLVAVGGYTRGSGSGLGCADRWPLCKGGALGGLLPRGDTRMVVEWTHRWLAATVGLLAVGTAVVAWRAGKARAPATAMVAAIAVQGLIGREVVVRGLDRDLVTLHLAVALIICWLGARTAVVASGAPRAFPDGAPSGPRRAWVQVAAVLTAATVLAGSAVHNRFVGGWPLVGNRLVPAGLTDPTVGLHTLHRVLAATGAIVVVAAFFAVRNDRRLRALVGGAVAGYLANAALGAVHVATQVRSAAVVAAHLGVGAATWALLVAGTSLLRRPDDRAVTARPTPVTTPSRYPPADSRPTGSEPGHQPDFGWAPRTVAWEITRACPLRCLHCRADAQVRRDSRELTTAEGFDLIAQVADMGAAVLVITGGDPLARPDVYEFIAAGARAGLHVGFSPSVTPRLTPVALARAVDAGAATIHLSLDGASAATHDGFRGVPSSFERTLRMIDAAAALPVRLQVGTTVARRTVGDLSRIPQLLAGRADAWTIFFCVPTGRAGTGDVLDAHEHEQVLTWLASTPLPVPVRTVAAPTYRRVLAQLGRPVAGAPVNDGRGFCFVSHVGEVCPSGFLQLPVGNVRERPLAEWYRDHPLFCALRDPSRLGGRCGRCPYREVCGGSRARAWAMLGDPLAEDPTCAYDPDAAREGLGAASPS